MLLEEDGLISEKTEKTERKTPPNILQHGTPTLRVFPGQAVTVHCRNAFGMALEVHSRLVTGEALDVFLEHPQKDALGHPVTNHIEVSGMSSPYSLKIDIHHIEIEQTATCLSKSTGILKNRYPGRQSKVFSVSEGRISLGKGITLVGRPSIGCVATLDQEARRPSRCSFLGGNMDLMELQAGSSIYLPMTMAPEQFAIGDVHFRQGSGEIPGLGLEADAKVTLSVSMAEMLPYPLIETPEAWVVVGWGDSNTEAQTMAVNNAIDLLGRNLPLEEVTLYQLLGGVGDLVVGNLTGKISTFGVKIAKRCLYQQGYPMNLSPRPQQKQSGVSEIENAEAMRAILSASVKAYNTLPILHQGDSREIRDIQNIADIQCYQPKLSGLVIQRLNPKIFSFTAGKAVDVPGTEHIRAQLNQIFCEHLHKAGVETTTLAYEGNYVLMKKSAVANLEVIVKAALIGSPKHLYPKLSEFATRDGRRLQSMAPHEPYVRFDWRDPTSKNDIVMPEGLAEHFIDTVKAKDTALKAFYVLKALLNTIAFDLRDCCFFMPPEGNYICAEVSPDNLGGIVYQGEDDNVQALFQSKNKEDLVRKWQFLLDKLST